MTLARALYQAPFTAPFANALEAEYRALPPARRLQANRKRLQRDALLWATGQRARQRMRVPAGVRRVLWVCTWTTVGDAVLDLAARALIPARIELDLCIAPALAPLFERDTRFARVHVDPASCGDAFDFVLLDCLSTASIRLKKRCFPMLPFASVRGHLLGERFDRAAFGDLRIRQLFALGPGDVASPFLTLGEPERPPVARSRIAVPLGARVQAKRYPHWPAVLARLVAQWPASRPPPLFELIGHGVSAREDLHGFDADFLGRCCRVTIDAGTLRDAGLVIAGCDAFLGVDGGLMHVAIGVGVPGLALFTGVDPAWFLRPGSRMRPLRSEGPLAALAPDAVARCFGERLDSLSASPPR